MDRVNSNLGGSTVETDNKSIDSLRKLSVKNCKCQFEKDRKFLAKKISMLYKSDAAFENFAKFSGIAMMVNSLMLSPAIYTEERYNSFISPWLELARELHFDQLYSALAAFDCQNLFLSVRTTSSPDLNPLYANMVFEHFEHQVGPLVRQAKFKATNNEDTLVAANPAI